MTYELGICIGRKDGLGRTESTTTIREKDNDFIGGAILCSCTFVGLELKDAMKLTEKIFIKSLNEANDRVSEIGTK